MSKALDVVSAEFEQITQIHVLSTFEIAMNKTGHR